MLLNVNHQSESVHCRTFVSCVKCTGTTDNLGGGGSNILLPAETPVYSWASKTAHNTFT